MRRGWWLWAIIVGVWLLTIPFLLQRAALERSNRSVEIVVDLASLRDLSAETGVSPDEILSRWSAYGVTAVAVTDPDEIELVQRVGLRLVPRSIAVLEAVQEREIPGDVRGPFISMGDVVAGYPDALPDVARVLTDLGIPFGVVEFSNQRGGRELAGLVGSGNVFVHPIPRNEIVHMSDGQALARFNRAMLERQARVLYVHPLLGLTLGGSGATATPGSPGTESGGGAGNVPASSRTESDNPATFTRNDAFIRAIGERAAALGLHVGPVTPLPPWSAPPVLSVLITVAAAAALLLVGRTVVRPSPGWELFFLGAAAGTSAVLVVSGRDELARQAAALSVACVFPILACLPWRAMATNGSSPQTEDAARSLGRGAVAGASAKTGTGVTIGTRVDAIRVRHGSRFAVILPAAYDFCRVTAITFVGAGLVAASLSDTVFFLKLEQFRGVKLAHLVPPAVMAAAWAREALRTDGMALRPSGSWRAAWQRVRERTGWRHLVIGLVVLGATFVLVARTGHYVLPVTTWERAAREALEQWLVVRPRTKEFLLGYPALVVGLQFSARERRDAAWPWLIAGTVASVSVINTFAHAHVSLAVSTVRTFYGMLLGLVVALAGIAAWSVWRRWRDAVYPRVTTGMRVR